MKSSPILTTNDAYDFELWTVTRGDQQWLTVTKETMDELPINLKNENKNVLFISLIVSGRYPENPAIWLVLGVGSIFLSPDHGHGNQLR